MIFRQLICFEKLRNLKTANHLDVAVRDVFRAMMPVFNNENRSVITPLLATGSQVAIYFLLDVRNMKVSFVIFI